MKPSNNYHLVVTLWSLPLCLPIVVKAIISIAAIFSPSVCPLLSFFFTLSCFQPITSHVRSTHQWAPNMLRALWSCFVFKFSRKFLTYEMLFPMFLTFDDWLPIAFQKLCHSSPNGKCSPWPARNRAPF